VSANPFAAIQGCVVIRVSGYPHKKPGYAVSVVVKFLVTSCVFHCYIFHYFILCRCGRDALIPGYRLLAQCNPDSQHPCCNLNTGFCGSGPNNCQCENCTDFRDMVSAELARWRPKKCTLKYYPWRDSCSLLEDNDISLHFIGKTKIARNRFGNHF